MRISDWSSDVCSSDLLTIELIVSRVRTVNRGLKRDFGIACPRLAIAGLNPHAGENGNMGTEEVEIIRPAIEMLRAEGIDANGPFSADTSFDHSARKGYEDRKSVVQGKRVSVRVDIGGPRSN